MSVSIDVAWRSLNKYQEELCGDKVEIVKTGDSDIVILADGMGSGVKANILATLTTKILGTMLNEGAAIESCVETIARTLPICKVRKVAYATFSILQIFHSGQAYLAEFDNPSCVFIRDGKIVDYPYEVREIEGKKIHECRFRVKKNDCFVLVSDGVIYAGAGSILNMQGWTWEAVAEYTLKCTRQTMSASRLAVLLSQACDELYEEKPGDDTTVAVARVIERWIVSLFTGPPKRSEPPDSLSPPNQRSGRKGQKALLQYSEYTPESCLSFSAPPICANCQETPLIRTFLIADGYCAYHDNTSQHCPDNEQREHKFKPSSVRNICYCQRS